MNALDETKLPLVFGPESRISIDVDAGVRCGLFALCLMIGCSPGKKGGEPESVADATEKNNSAEQQESTDPASGGDGSGGKASENDGDGGNSKPGAGTDSSEQSSESDAGESKSAGPGAKFDLGGMPEAEKKEIRPCEIDFLFVVDNSISMKTKQENLSRSVPKFIETMMHSTEFDKDFHIGVVTTDKYKAATVDCNFLGGLVTQVESEVPQPDGSVKKELKRCGPYKSGRNYMTHKDDLERSFTCAAQPGVTGAAEERQIGAILGAIDPSRAGTGQCNEGFIRESAILVTVVITDEDVGFDKGTAAQWHSAVLSRKGDDPKKAVTVSIVVPPKNLCDPGDPFIAHGDDLIEFTGLFKERGFVGDVCSPSYDPIFKEAISIIDFACGELVDPPG